MPILPSVSQIERPIPRPAGTVVTAQPVPSGIEEGRSLEYAGAQVNQFAQVLEREQERIDANRAEEAFNKLRMQQIDLTSGDNGFSTKMGSNAVGRPLIKEYGTRFDDAARTISQDLSNERQRTYFTKRSEVARLQFNADIVRHQQQQATVLAKQVFKSTLDIENQNAVARWNDPEALNLSLTRIEAAVRNEADREGWDKQTADAVLLGERSKVHQAVIGQALATGNVVFANDYFKRNREQIDLQTARATEHAVVDAEQRQLTHQYRSAFIQSRDSIQGLRNLEKQITSDKTLADDRKDALLGPIASHIDVLNNKAIAAQQARVRAVERTIGKFNSRILSGLELSPEETDALITLTKGTEFEGEVTQLVNLSRVTASYRTAPPAQQESMVIQLEADVRRNPSEQGEKVLNAFKVIAQNQKRELDDAPVRYAYENRIFSPVAIDFSDPMKSAEQINYQIGVARAMQAGWRAPLKPLMPSQLADIRSQLGRATPEQKLKWFGSLHQATAGDPDAYSAMMSQLAPDDPVTAVAGAYAARGRDTPARLMVEGQSLLRPTSSSDGKPDQGKIWPMPKDDEMRKQFQIVEGNAFQGHAQLRNAVYQSTVAIYAKLSEEAGDAQGEINPTRFKEAMTMAAGPIAMYKGRKTILPYGMDLSAFKDGMKARVNDLVSSGTLDKTFNAERLGDYPVYPIGEGRYWLQNAKGFVHDKTGNRVVINFNNPTTWSPPVNPYLQNLEEMTGAVGK